MLIKENIEIEIKRFYDLKFNEETKARVNINDKKTCKTTFENSVKLRLRADVPVGSCLSGGLDSSSYCLLH